MLNNEASDKQKKFFFALCHELGYDTEEMKDRAKKKYNLEKFNDITTPQLSDLIDILQQKKSALPQNPPQPTPCQHEQWECSDCHIAMRIVLIPKDLP